MDSKNRLIPENIKKAIPETAETFFASLFVLLPAWTYRLRQ